MLFGASSEKTSRVLGEESEKDKGSAVPLAGSEKDGQAGSKKKPKGHGRNGADAYEGAERIKVSHEALDSGNACPTCDKGKVYSLSKPGLIIRVKGQAPLGATVYELEKLRCNLCGEVFTAKAPDGTFENKYDERAASMIALFFTGQQHSGRKPREGAEAAGQGTRPSDPDV